MVEDNLIEGTLKYRDGKKWKQRWAVLNKLSPVADVLQLQLYRDSRDKARGAPTKASLALTNTLALITGFTLDKESHTLALLCKDLSLLLAYESRDRLLQWSSKLNSTFGSEQQFLVQLVQVPLKSRVALGPSRMHVRNHRFCLTAGTPPRLLAAWSSADVRRYGVVDGRFVWEGGTRCGRGAGIHVALSDAPHDITRALDLAARGGLKSLSRRSSTAGGNAINVHRDAAAWLREIGALDLSKFSETGDTASLLTSEAGSILSPHGSCLSRNDLASGHWSVERRPSCAAHESYITGGSSSSSGSLTSDDPGWWANTWTSARGSLWEVAPPSPVPENLYDSPRSIIHQPCSFAAHTTTSTNHHWCTQSMLIPKQQNQCHVGCQRLYVTPNPLDNYDVPKNHLLNYDTPRRIHTTQDRGTFCHAEAQTRGVDACGRVLGWAGALMCRRQDTSLEYVEPVRLSGEGRMPVLDANTGTIIHPKFLSSCSDSSTSCSCSSQCASTKAGVNQEPRPTERKVTTSLSSCPIYAVVDKSKKLPKPRAPTPPPSPPEQTEPNANYANIPYSISSKDLNESDKTKDTSDFCHQCGGLFTHDISLSEVEPSPIQHEKHNDKKEDEADYLVMGPGSYTVPPSDYLCMESKTNTSTSVPKKADIMRHPSYRPGRSLSLARHDRSPSSSHRRSSSADSRLHEPWETSQFNTPDPTPAATPLPSPPPTPFRTSTPQYESSGGGRGRSRKRVMEREPRENCSGSSIGSGSLETPNSDATCQVSCNDNDNLSAADTPLILRRSSSVPVQKSANRDSASSSDSGVCESPRPSDRILLSHCLHSSLPRGSRHKHGYSSNGHHQNTGTTLGSCREIGPTTTVDAKSSSSGTSDISDYLDTLSMSSHSSSDHERLLGRASVTTLRPRSGREYSRLDRSALDSSILPVVGEIPPSRATN